MKRYLSGMLATLLLTVTGCTPPLAPEQAQQPQEVTSEQKAVSPAQQQAALPGTERLEEPGLSGVGYPEGTLFTRDSVLPLPGGSALLEPLVGMLKETTSQRWKIVLSARTGHGADYDQRLAGKRLTIVQRYLQNRGVDLDLIAFAVDLRSTMPLLLVSVAPQESSSAVVNE